MISTWFISNNHRVIHTSSLHWCSNQCLKVHLAQREERHPTAGDFTHTVAQVGTEDFFEHINSAFSHAAMWWLIVTFLTFIALSRMATLTPALCAGGMKLTTHRPRHLAKDWLLLLPQCSLPSPMTRSWPRVTGQFLLRLILPLKKHLHLPERSLGGINCSPRPPPTFPLRHLNSNLEPLLLLLLLLGSATVQQTQEIRRKTFHLHPTNSSFCRNDVDDLTKFSLSNFFIKIKH